MLTDDQLREIEERCEKATRGPWGYKAGILKHYVFSPDDNFGFSLQEVHYLDGHETNAEADAKFVAHSREDMSTLLAEVRELRKDAALGRAVRKALLQLPPPGRWWNLSTRDTKELLETLAVPIAAVLRAEQAQASGMADLGRVMREADEEGPDERAAVPLRFGWRSDGTR